MITLLSLTRCFVYHVWDCVLGPSLYQVSGGFSLHASRSLDVVGHLAAQEGSHLIGTEHHITTVGACSRCFFIGRHVRFERIVVIILKEWNEDFSLNIIALFILICMKYLFFRESIFRR